MLLAIMALLAVQTGKPASSPSDENDIYTACFLRELSVLEGHDMASWRGGFSQRNGAEALQRCRPARDRLAADIEAQLAADPAYADQRLRAVTLENRMMIVELPLLMLVRDMGR